MPPTGRQKSFERQSLHGIRYRNQADTEILCDLFAIQQIPRTQITAQELSDNVVVSLFGECGIHRCLRSKERIHVS